MKILKAIGTVVFLVASIGLVFWVMKASGRGCSTCEAGPEASTTVTI